MSINKLLIANRGEIAVRIIRAARDLGIPTVQVFSAADVDSLAVKIADESIEIGPPAAAKSYLNIEAILNAAKITGADAIHPGYGFLAENADFVDAVEAASLIFVGPSGDMIRKMGDKAAARQAAVQANIPVVPGSDGLIDDMKEASETAIQLGFPVMIKATAGGGGRGIRVAHSLEEFQSLTSEAAMEAKAAFNNGGLYLEKFIPRARHIEVQILGDGDHCIHCYERECSLQRRRQKIWEEAPSIALTDEIRGKLCESAVALAQSVGYRGVGTVEYLYDDDTEQYYFIEMNTRIQVEHPVTECIVGIDLLTEMIRIAAGEKLSLSQSDIAVEGHAIEVRINAEDPTQNFMPSPGLIESLLIPDGPGIRFDHMLYCGYNVPPFYDSLLGKLIVFGATREIAISRLKRAMRETQISGIKTTLPLFEALARDDAVLSGQVHTKWLEPWLDNNKDTLTSQNRGIT